MRSFTTTSFFQKTLHGDCDVSYTFTEGMVYKAVAHMKDCTNRKFRFIDDWRGYRCNVDWKNPQKKESTDGLYSQATSAYKIEGGSVKAMMTQGSLVGNMYEAEGMSHFAVVNMTAILIDEKSSSGKLLKVPRSSQKFP